MSKGGSTTSQVQIPQYLEDAARRNLSRASQISNIGYTPYFGADVAAMTPMQQAAMQGTNQMASAFGLPSVSDPMAGMPQAQDFGGIQAYSSAPMYEQSLQSLAQNRPEQYQAIEGMFNPTGGTSYGGGYGSGGGYGTTTSGGGVSASDVAGTALGAYGAYKAIPAVASKVGGLLGIGSDAAGTAAGDAAITAGDQALNSALTGVNAVGGNSLASTATLANPNVAFSGLPTFANSALAQGGALAAGSNALAAGSSNLAGLSGLGGASISGTAPATSSLVGGTFNPASWDALSQSASQIGTTLGTGTGANAIAPTATKALGAFGTGGTSGIGALPTFSQLSALAPYAAAPFLLDPIGKHVISPIADALGFGSAERERKAEATKALEDSGFFATNEAIKSVTGKSPDEYMKASQKVLQRSPYKMSTADLQYTDDGRLEEEAISKYYSQDPRGKAKMARYYAENPEYFTPGGTRRYPDNAYGDILRAQTAYNATSPYPQGGVGISPMLKINQMAKDGTLSSAMRDRESFYDIITADIGTPGASSQGIGSITTDEVSNSVGDGISNTGGEIFTPLYSPEVQAMRDRETFNTAIRSGIKTPGVTKALTDDELEEQYYYNTGLL